MVNEEKLQTRRAIKKRKPTFLRRQAHQFAKLKKVDAWRRPKGMGNKSRRNRRGHIGMLKVGYGSPREIKGTNRDGYFEVIISNMKDLELIDTKTQVGVLSHTLGKKKRLDVLRVAQKKNITISNVKDIATYIKTVEENFKAKKDLKQDSKKTPQKSAKQDSTKDSSANTKTSDDASKKDTTQSTKKADSKASDKTSSTEKKSDESNKASKSKKADTVSKNKESSSSLDKKSSDVSKKAVLKKDNTQSVKKTITTTTTTTTKSASVSQASSTKKTSEVNKK
ncbi:MAG: eL32 family ribosomal protein [Candidatus Nanoarchaeia archaeon]